MNLHIVSGTAHSPLTEAIAAGARIRPTPCSVERFPDGELRPDLQGVRGADLYVVQPTGPVVNENVVELMLLLDAARRTGAERITAVVPYFGYARQDRRDRTGQAVGSRVVLDALSNAGADRLLVVDPHTSALEAMCDVPVEMLTAVPGMAAGLASSLSGETVVVAPDLGAVKLAEHYAALLHAPVAVVRKSRKSGSSVRAEELVGPVEGRSALVVDDMISTGGTVEAAVRILLDHGASPGIVVAATHGLMIGPAVERLAALPLRRLLVTDSVPQQGPSPLPREVHSLAALLAEAISRLHRDESVDDLLVHG